MTKALAAVVVALTDAWTSSASGLWSLASDWSLGAEPTSGESVVISTPSPLSVTFDVGGTTIAGLSLVDDALNLFGGSLATSGASNLQDATIGGPRMLMTKGATTAEGVTIDGGAYWYNTCTVTQSSGTVTIGDATASLIDNEAGATWTLDDASGFAQGSAAGSHFLNAGLFQKTSGYGVALVKANFVSTGVIASAANGDIEFDGKSTSLSGTYIGSGMVDYGPDGIATIGDVDVTAACCQTNWGIVELVGTMTMHDGSTIMNAAGARWNFYGDSSLLLAAGEAAGPDINGMGAIAKVKGTGTSVVGVVVDAEGAVTAATGTLAFEGATSQFSGMIGGAGTFALAGGQATLAAGARLAVAHWTLAGGVTTLGENISYAGAFAGEAGATLTLGGNTLTLTGTAQFDGLAITGSGVLRTGPTTTVSGLTIGGTTKFTLGGALTQSGGDVTLGDGTATDAATLVVGAGASYSLADHSILLGADPASSIIIAGSPTVPGLLAKTGAGLSLVAPAIVNSGSNVTTGLGGIEAAAGTLEIEGAVSGAGADNVVGASVLQFDNVVSGAQTVFFSGAGGTLDLTDLAGFHAKISGFDTTGSDDALLIGGGWSFTGANETATAATLGFANGSLHQTLTLTGDYVGGAFSAQSLGGGISKLTYTP